VAGTNKQSSEVSNAQSGKFKAGAKGAGSGVVVKGSGSLVIDKDAEQALAQKFETTWYSEAMHECRLALSSEKKGDGGAVKSKGDKPAQKPAAVNVETKENKPAQNTETTESIIALPASGESGVRNPTERPLEIRLPAGARIVSVQAFAKEKGASSWQECLQGDESFDCNLGWARFKGAYQLSVDGRVVTWPVQNWSANREREARMLVVYHP
jgi:hypothetical protein